MPGKPRPSRTREALETLAVVFYGVMLVVVGWSAYDDGCIEVFRRQVCAEDSPIVYWAALSVFVVGGVVMLLWAARGIQKRVARVRRGK